MRRLLRTGLALAILIALAAGAAALYGYNAFERPGPLAQDKTLVIARGSGVAAIARQLADEGALREPLIFRVAAELLGRAGDLRAGEYLFPAGVSQHGLLDILTSGDTVVRRLTVPEGLNSTEVVGLVNAAEGLTGLIEEVPADGTLLPETFHYSWGDKRLDLIARMQRDMVEVQQELWAGRAEDLPFDSLEEAVVLASLIEKETGVAQERPLVASVFVNRLKKGMRLQSDPTVVYALTEGKTPLGRALLRKDWEVDHPYNTYRIVGLPPGPIANPGRGALAAALNPATTSYLFFVADGSGGHAFAETLAEHNRNVARWRKIKAKGD